MSYSIGLLEASVSSEERIILLKSPLCRHLKNAGNQPQKSLFHLTVNEVEFTGHISRIIMLVKLFSWLPESKRDWPTEQVAFFLRFSEKRRKAQGKREAEARPTQERSSSPRVHLSSPSPPFPLSVCLAHGSDASTTKSNFFKLQKINDQWPQT